MLRPTQTTQVHELIVSYALRLPVEFWGFGRGSLSKTSSPLSFRSTYLIIGGERKDEINSYYMHGFTRNEEGILFAVSSI